MDVAAFSFIFFGCWVFCFRFVICSAGFDQSLIQSLQNDFLKFQGIGQCSVAEAQIRV